MLTYLQYEQLDVGAAAAGGRTGTEMRPQQFVHIIFDKISMRKLCINVAKMMKYRKEILKHLPTNTATPPERRRRSQSATASEWNVFTT